MRVLKKCLGVCAFVFLVTTFSTALPVEISGGDLKLVFYPDVGSFSLYQISNIGKYRYEPLFEDRNDSASTWFSVISNGRIFKLARRTGKPVEFFQTVDSGRFVFTLTDDFQVEQKFSFINNPVSGIPCAVKVETSIENTSGKEGNFALRALFDTTLGEANFLHFQTNLRKRISSETRLNAELDRDSVVISGTGDNSLMFPLAGEAVTRPQYVYMSNWDRLNTLSWIPDFVEGRSFNTMYAINDSALLFIWPTKKLAANKKYTITMILGPYVQELIPSSNTSASSLYSAGTDVRDTDLSVENGNANTDIAIPEGAMDKSETQKMINQILVRIQEIEVNPDSASDAELQQLNKTLDALFKQLGE